MSMRLFMVYVYPMVGNPQHVDYALRFVESYNHFPPGENHTTIVITNGGKADGFVKALFASLYNVQFMEHDNLGWDIGGFQAAARQIGSGLCLFCGTSVWFTRPEWMERVTTSRSRWGSCLYGAMGNQGDGRVNVFPHLRTTGFWLDAELMNKYPLRTVTYADRYRFEHGRDCLAEWVKGMGLHRLVVTWGGEYALESCDSIPNGFHRGDQSELIFRDRLTEPPYY